MNKNHPKQSLAKIVDVDALRAPYGVDSQSICKRWRSGASIECVPKGTLGTSKEFRRRHAIISATLFRVGGFFDDVK